MADPPAGGPEPPPTNTQETQASFSVEDFQPRVSIDAGQIIGKRTRNGEAYTPAEGTGRITTREVWKLIDNLKDIIHRQTTLIESTKADLEEVKHDQNVLREQNDRLHEEVRALRAQIETSPQPNPPRTWAAIAASGTSDPQPSLQRPEKDRNCVRISTQRLSVDPRDNESREGNSFGRYLSTDSANPYIRSALLSAPPTQDAQVAGIGTTKTGYLVRFKDPGSAEAARNNTEWLNELGKNTKLVKPRFGVVVHRTPTENFDLENANSQAIQTIMEENDLAEQGFQIEELAWLKRKDKVLGKFASLGIWFDSAEGAEYILNNGLLVGQRYIGSVERREIKKKRCFRCQRFGHLAWSYKETPRCGHCAGQHERERCPPGVRARVPNTIDLQPYQMLEKYLRILQLNMMKSGPRMEALINDPQSRELDVLLIQEPSITTYRTHINHSAWHLSRPTTQTDAVRFRSLLYVNRRISTSSHRQLPYDHPDVAAVKIWTADSQRW
ncbi:Probable transposable element [Penicillium roqueforti FM164]|uniref:Probable transposable element n=1 Tax=Penicillium roqueforti (strain FM164) TaxID=1365484 RepID=W6QTD0_PENRF|nr:Probable transposable element [Penicillium roqueforti FM164]